MKPVIKIITGLLFLFIFSCVQSLHAQQDSLNSYLKQAAENNVGLKAAFNKYMAALQKVDATGVLPDPKLAFGYFISPVETRVGPQESKISITQMFPWFGKLNYEKKVAAEIAKARYQEFVEARNQLFLNVKTLWFQYYDLEQKIRITQEHLKILESDKALATVRYSSGMVSMTDVLRAEMEISELKEKVSYYIDSRDPLNAKFNQLLNAQGRTMTVPDSLSLNEIETTISSTLDSVMKNNPVLQKFVHQSQSLQNQLMVAKKSGFPDFSLSLDYVILGKRNDMEVLNNGQDAIMPMVGINIPIHQKKYKAMQQEVKYNMQTVNNTTDNTRNMLQSRLATAFRDYNDAQRRIKLNQNQMLLAQQSLNILTASYSSAGQNFEEVLRMERKWLNYELELQKAYTDQNIAVAEINYLVGK